MKTNLLSDAAPAVCSAAFLEEIMHRHAPEREVRVRAVRPAPLDSSASILANLSVGQAGRPLGLFGLSVELRTAGGPWHWQPLVLKIKPPGREVSQLLTALATAHGGPLVQVYPPFELQTGFAATHHRELAVYAEAAARRPAAAGPLPLLPTVWATHADEATETYYVLLENLQGAELLNSVREPTRWTDAHLRAALTQLAAWHAWHLWPEAAGPLRVPAVPTPPAGAKAAPAAEIRPGRAYMQALTPLWEALLRHAATHCPALYPAPRVRRLEAITKQIPAYWRTLEAQPKTLIHNDLNPRNACFKRCPDGNLQFVAYDWELATYHVPHYDVMELLTFVLGPERAPQLPAYLAHYRQALHELTGLYPSQAEFDEVARLAAYDFGLHRLGLYLMAHAVSPYP
ncbi:phosphotransferase, partial [uncultured Hymenobacter sp.]|uniref:phosphotransferase n=1 Tax=uncultured Hymenobacter sp. TaxID=170016 RepID=UPI0035C9BC8C